MAIYEYKPEPTWTATLGGSAVDISGDVESWDFSHGADIDDQSRRYIPRPCAGALVLYNGSGRFDPTSAAPITTQDDFDDAIAVSYTCGNDSWSGLAVAPAERAWGEGDVTVWELVDAEWPVVRGQTDVDGLGPAADTALTEILGAASEDPSSRSAEDIRMAPHLDVTGWRAELAASLAWLTGAVPYLTRDGRMGLCTIKALLGDTAAAAPALQEILRPASRVRRLPSITTVGLTIRSPVTELAASQTLATETWTDAVTDFLVYLPQGALGIESFTAVPSSGAVTSVNAVFSGGLYRVRVVVDGGSPGLTVTLSGRVRRRSGEKEWLVTTDAAPEVKVTPPAWINTQHADFEWDELVDAVGLLSVPRVVAELEYALWGPTPAAVPTTAQLSPATRSMYRISPLLEMDMVCLNVRRRGRRGTIPRVLIQAQVIGDSSHTVSGNTVLVTGPTINLSGQVRDAPVQPVMPMEPPGVVGQPGLAVNAAGVVTVSWVVPSGTPPFTFDVVRAAAGIDPNPTTTSVADDTAGTAVTDDPGQGTWRYRVQATNMFGTSNTWSLWATIEVEPGMRTAATAAGSVVLTGTNSDAQGVVWVAAFDSNVRTPDTSAGSVVLSGSNSDAQGVVWVEAFGNVRTPATVASTINLNATNTDGSGVVWLSMFVQTRAGRLATAASTINLSNSNSDAQGIIWLDAFVETRAGRVATAAGSVTLTGTNSDAQGVVWINAFEPAGRTPSTIAATRNLSGSNSDAQGIVWISAFQAGAPSPTFADIDTVFGATVAYFTFNPPLDESHVPPASAFTYTRNGGAWSIISVSFGLIPGSSSVRGLAIATESGISSGNTLRVTYTKPTATNSRLQDAAGNQVENFDLSRTYS